ncbi:TonB family protein [Novosphingobium sp. FSY-8]|uniref:TonB family protein n=1 Tax=Novosphingobium ovatum TaxID=1908523 RepID=A0ABW9XEU5_9SPHN|nr:energy transducer TonB [Novosphingobium ovatum]NBC37057.1 TonB family protein [Novosphingobium ovatum]
MTYAASRDIRAQIRSAGVVTIIHVAVAAVLVTGLAYTGVIRDHARTGTFDIPLPPPPVPQPPVPQPTAKPVERTADPIPQTDTIDLGMPDIGPITRIDPVPTPRPDPLPLPTATHASVPAKPAAPRGRPGDWATADDYPSMDLRQNHEGVTRFSLSIGTDGRVTSCTVTGSSGFAGLDAATCNLVMRRARFTPAMNEDGQPTIGTYSNAVRWVIPQ